MATFTIGDAVWTNGSTAVTFTQPNLDIVMLNDYFPYTDPNTGGLVMAGEWGTGWLDTNYLS